MKLGASRAPTCTNKADSSWQHLGAAKTSAALPRLHSIITAEIFLSVKAFGLGLQLNILHMTSFYLIKAASEVFAFFLTGC